MQNINFISFNKIIETQPFINLTEIHFNFAFGIQYQHNSLLAINICKKYFNSSIILKEWMNK